MRKKDSLQSYKTALAPSINDDRSNLSRIISPNPSPKDSQIPKLNGQASFRGMEASQQQSNRQRQCFKVHTHIHGGFNVQQLGQANGIFNTNFSEEIMSHGTLDRSVA